MTRDEAKKHGDIIKAFGDGAKIQCYDEFIEGWLDVYEPSFCIDFNYRVKPEIKHEENND